jgi:ribosomal protein S18 acetylase RimI-like enzyme
VSGTEVRIRAAVRADAPAIAALHVTVWRATYRDLAPPEALRILDLEFRLKRWVETLEQGERTVLVAENGGHIVGIGTAGAASVPELTPHGEILYLYVNPAFGGRGIGRALMRALGDALQRQGYRSAALGVVVGNDAAIAFYQKLGGRIAGQYTDPGPIWRSRNQIIVWDDLQVLLDRA